MMYCNCILNNVLFREIATVSTQVKQNSSTFSAQNQWIRENLLDAHVLFHSLMYAVNVFTSNK